MLPCLPPPKEAGKLREAAPRHAPTFSAVLASPAGVADLLSPLPAREVAEGVVAWAAEDGAALPVVVLVAHEAVGILEVRAAATVQVLGPLLTHRQVPLRGQAADEPFRVFCGNMALPLVRHRTQGLGPRGGWGGGTLLGKGATDPPS